MPGTDPAEVAASQDNGYLVRVRSGHFVLRIGQVSSQLKALRAEAGQGGRP